MRSHHAAVTPTDRTDVTPPQLDAEFAHWLALDADYRTAPSMVDIWTCQLCGHAGGFAETVATAIPLRRGAEKICWHCLVSILMYRGVISPTDQYVPALYGFGTIRLNLEVLQAASLGDRRPYAPSDAH